MYRLQTDCYCEVSIDDCRGDPYYVLEFDDGTEVHVPISSPAPERIDQPGLERLATTLGFSGVVCEVNENGAFVEPE